MINGTAEKNMAEKRIVFVWTLLFFIKYTPNEKTSVKLDLQDCCADIKFTLSIT